MVAQGWQRLLSDESAKRTTTNAEYEAVRLRQNYPKTWKGDKHPYQHTAYSFSRFDTDRDVRRTTMSKSEYTGICRVCSGRDGYRMMHVEALTAARTSNIHHYEAKARWHRTYVSDDHINPCGYPSAHCINPWCRRNMRRWQRMLLQAVSGMKT